jgi:hypothetical protein
MNIALLLLLTLSAAMAYRVPGSLYSLKRSSINALTRSRSLGSTHQGRLLATLLKGDEKIAKLKEIGQTGWSTVDGRDAIFKSYKFRDFVQVSLSSA